MSKSDRNIFDIIFFSSFCSFLFLLLLNYVTNISPINGNWLLLYALCVLIVSIWITCVVIQYLLRLNAPIKYDIQHFLTKWPLLLNLNRVLPISCLLKTASRVPLEQKRRNQYDTNELSVISTVIEKKFVSSWYTTYVSQEIGFPFACKELLDQMINKMFEHCGNVDSMKLVADMLAIILKHIKEYNKAQKRQEKAGKGDVDDHYKTIHVISSENSKGKIKLSTEHLTNIIKIFLKELLPWELWDTPQSSLLVSILTKKLDDFVANNLSQPEWLLEQLARVFVADQSVQKEAETEEKSLYDVEENNQDLVKELVQHIETTRAMSIETVVPKLVDDPVENQNNLEFQTNLQTTTIESALSQMISHSTAPILQRASDASSLHSYNHSKLNIETGSPQNTSEPLDIHSSGPSLRNRKKPRPISEVRVHDRIIEGSVKTWDLDTDLECISLGQDLLASLDGEMGLESRLGRLWEADNLEGNDAWSPNPPPSSGDSKSPQSLWFGEEDTFDMELSVSENSPPKSSSQNVRAHESHSTNFSLSNIHNIKDLQNISKSTVNQAKHKIGDLQDEAAGVMEGILDLGMAGLRKGLRLTRLQDSQTDPKETNSRDNSKSLSVDSAKSSSASLDLQKSPVSTSSGKYPIQKPLDKDMTDPAHRHVAAAVGALVKQSRVTSQDNITLPNNAVKDMSPSKKAVTHSHLGESPAPAALVPPVPGDSPSLEYEDPADLASTIAKLRQLLQQKSSSDGMSNPSEDNSSFELLPRHCNTPLPGPATPNATTSGSNNTNSSSNNNQSGLNNTNSGHSNDTYGNQVSNVTSLSTVLPNCMDSSPQPISEAKGRVDTRSNVKPIDVATFADEYDDLPVHRAHIPAAGSTNNMQRLDRLFTRTVTGVFNTIKTAVGADSPPEGRDPTGPHNGGRDTNGSLLRTPSHRKNAKVQDGWLFIEGEVDACAAIGALVAEKRNHCFVEAAQDSLEALVPTQATPAPTITLDSALDEDYEECGSSRVRAWRALLGIAAATLGGPLSRHAVTHCVTVLGADKAESAIEECVAELTSWLHEQVFVVFRRMAQQEIKSSKCASADGQTQAHICELIIDQIPGFLVPVLGRSRVTAALDMLFGSVQGPRARLDLAAQLLDVLASHYMRAAILQ